MEIELQSLCVLIGANGSGKSNLLDAFSLLQATPSDILKPIRDGGGVRNWLWKGIQSPPVANIEVLVKNIKEPLLRYSLGFTETNQRFEVVQERIENEKPHRNTSPYLYYSNENGRAFLNINEDKRYLKSEDIDPVASILSQRKDPEQYPEITYLGDLFSKICLYREWSFGRYNAPRLPQKSDLPNNILDANASNLGLVLNKIRLNPAAKKRLLKALRLLYENIEDYDVSIEGGTVQVFLQEGNFSIPATRLSDGTLRYLCLLAILCNPSPPPLICIEEPELGLHPDIIPSLAELMKEYSRHSQLIVTTHSDILVDAMSDQPESVFVCEKTIKGTTVHALNPQELKPWLEKYRLGQLWTKGELGGTRW